MRTNETTEIYDPIKIFRVQFLVAMKKIFKLFNNVFSSEKTKKIVETIGPT